MILGVTAKVLSKAGIPFKSTLQARESCPAPSTSLTPSPLPPKEAFLDHPVWEGAPLLAPSWSLIDLRGSYLVLVCPAALPPHLTGRPIRGSAARWLGRGLCSGPLALEPGSEPHLLPAVCSCARDLPLLCLICQVGVAILSDSQAACELQGLRNLDGAMQTRRQPSFLDLHPEPRWPL